MSTLEDLLKVGMHQPPPLTAGDTEAGRGSCAQSGSVNHRRAVDECFYYWAFSNEFIAANRMSQLPQAAT